MTPFFVILYIMYFASSITQGEKDKFKCNDHQGNYNITSVLGRWHVVALIPEEGFPRMRKTIKCYKMDVSETDEAGVRWLVSKKISNPSDEFIQKVTGTIIRQRYHSEKPFDIWSKSLFSVRGCFRQLLTLETNNTKIGDAEHMDTYMQLHVMESEHGFGPTLVQILWGRLISAVIYRRTPGTSMDLIDPIRQLLTKMKGAQLYPLICDEPSKEIIPPSFQRP